MGHVPNINPGFIPNQANSNANMNKLEQAISETNKALADLMNTSDELADVAGAFKPLGGNAKSDGTSSALGTQQAGRPDLYVPEAEAAAAAGKSADETDDIKRKRKERAFKEKLSMLKGLVSSMDMSELDPEDRATVEEFLKNADTIANLQGQLTFLENKEIYYMGLIEKHKQSQQGQ